MRRQTPLRTVRASIAAWFIACALPGVAHAQAPAEAPILVPPRIQAPPEIPYPEGAQGDGEVLLTITVQKDGSVRSVEVVKGAEPFASAAKDAALQFRFDPATRNGQPVAAKIRFAFTFRPPVVNEPAPEEPATTESPAPRDATPGSPSTDEAKAPAAAPKRPTRPAAIEVDVLGAKPPPAVQTLSRTEVRQIPGTFGDPFRALEMLPGVTPVASGLPYFYVRGAPPGNIGYFFDGVRIPYLFHVGVGPSIVNPAMVERVNLHAGGYPAQFGRFAGAIVTADSTAPRDDFHGEGNIRLFDAGAMVERGFADGRGTVLIGGRYSYTAALLSLFSPEVGLDYHDFQFRVTYDLTPKDRIGVFAFGAYDLLSQTENDVETIVFGSEFYRLDLRYERKLPNSGSLLLGTTFGYDQTRIGEQRNARDKLFATRVILNQPIGEKVTLRAGLDAQFDHYEADERRWADPEDPVTITYDALFPQRLDGAYAAWADVEWNMSPRVKVTPGLRLDGFTSAGTSAGAVSPRLSMEARVHPRVRLLHAFGVAQQPPAFIVPLPGLSIGNLQGGLQTSVQASAGVEVELPLGITSSVSLFDNVFLNMSDTLGVQRIRDLFSKEPRSLGYSRGLEVYVKRRLTTNLGGFFTYTYSKSMRSLGSSTFPSAFDRRHVLSAALAYDIVRKIRFGSRVTFYTGAPDLAGPNAVAPEDPLNPPRNPSFVRIDLRLERRFELKNSRWLTVVAEMVNSTLNKEVISGREIGPVSIPSIGVEGGF